ncbi:6-carboxy-5,6,7,8-tetrahydropterin synthase [Candidatus Phycosocius bacilliformis]|uniref:6-carboxy-5,6,7,8-tetrahydropterin synthase n=1 Tax=Candidatus Phycosocius bacilliformis TaxID=1445552 RepID=A0A2P2E993_9PROT|nr:6-carboxytetrahydropterin synthase QueD [Candidatus Phycosocius bacilliformis]GBF57622.1 6-carboxy-5,6,7,8-tetrahydropterin synthase [Candidatus Phycosocius bacilliformis]
MTRCLLTKSVTFDAAHHLHQGEADHPYRRLHGHSFRLDVSVEDEADGKDHWVRDFAELTRAIATVRDQLDHSFLNEIEGLETPTLENICVWVAKRLGPSLPNLRRVSVARPSLGEMCTLEIGV